MSAYASVRLKPIAVATKSTLKVADCLYHIVRLVIDKNSSGDEIANVNFFYNIAHVEASAYAH